MSSFGIAGEVKARLIERFQRRKVARADEAGSSDAPLWADVPDAFCRFHLHPGYQKIRVPRVAADRLGISSPFFRVHEGVAGATTRIEGREYINFASYNYLGLAGHPQVNRAARLAVDRYGTSASASRLVAGERPVQRDLEGAIAELYGVDDCIALVSGHATNVTALGCLFGPKDLIVHDSLIHNSVLQGAALSGAMRRSFPHNDCNALERLLGDIRGDYERVLIVVEGLYSMDGDVPDLRRLIALKRRHKAFLMVDEAHSLGVLGHKGMGIREHYNVAGTDVDIWMGTLSKSLAGCGGYIAGERALVEHLRYAAPGFVFSVGMSPPLAAASLEALRLLRKEPERVTRLAERSRLFLTLARQAGLNTGSAEGYAVIPAIVGSSLQAVGLSNTLFERGFNVQPIIYPAVEERAARLRFFLSAMHTEDQMRSVVETLAGLVG